MLRNHTTSRRMRYLLAYTFLYLLLAGLLVFFCKIQNRSLVYHADAWRQHLRALAYYGKWLRGNLWHLVHDHSLSVQAWSFGLGYGSDVLTTLHYYCIGEPLTVLTVLVPEKYTKYYFEFLILLRPYLAGLSFSAYAEYMIFKVHTKRGVVKQKNHCVTGESCAPVVQSDAFTEKGTSYCGDTHDAGTLYLGILAGALCYVFSGTVLYLGMLHPFFVTPMIYLPLLFLGVERVLQEKKPGIFMVSVWLAGLSNFYFFYMLAVMTAVYALVRVIASVRRELQNQVQRTPSDRMRRGKIDPIRNEMPDQVKRELADPTRSTLSDQEKKEFKDPIRNELPYQERRKSTDLIRSELSDQEQKSSRNFIQMESVIRAVLRRIMGLMGYAASATMAAGAVLVPILVQFQSDPRNATTYSVPLFYNKEYYAELFKNAVTFLNHPQYDTELCLSAVCIAAVIVLFFLRGHRQLKAAVIGAVVMLCLPVAGYVMNGGSYVINRWTFAVEFLFAYVLVVVWSEVWGRFHGQNCSNEERCPREGFGECFSGRVLKKRIIRTVAFALVLVTIILNIRAGYAGAPAGENGEGGRKSFASEFTDEQTAEEYMTAACRNESSAVKRYAETTENPSFYRYTGRDLTYNAGAQTQSSSTQFFWSLANGTVSDFFQALGVNEEQNFSYTDLDDRTALEALAGVKYYTIAYDNDYERQFVSYGFADCGTVPSTELAGRRQEENGEASNQNKEENSQGQSDTLLTPEIEASGNVQEKSGAVYGDDSWEAVVPTYHIYQNTFALPIGYAYAGVISRSDFDAMDLTERQEAMLQGAVLESEDEELLSDGNLEQIRPEFTEEKHPYTVEVGDGVSYISGDKAAGTDQMGTQSDGDAVCFVVSKSGAKMTLHFDAAEDAETYLVWRDLEVAPLGEAGSYVAYSGDLNAEDEEKVTNSNRLKADDLEKSDSEQLEGTCPITVTALKEGTLLTDKTLNYKTETNQYYSGWKDFALNMGYRADGADTLEITFQNEGVYSVSELSVVTQPAVEMMQHAVDLSACTMTDVNLHRNLISLASNEITGTVNAEQDRYLVFSIPYSKGWIAYDNGVKVPLQKANLMYLGMPIDAGNHEIRLVYHTPGGTAGILASIAGMVLMMVLCRKVVGE